MEAPLSVLEEFASEAQIEAASKVSRPTKLHVPRVSMPFSEYDRQEIEAEKRRLEADQRARAKLKRVAKKAAQDQSEANLGGMLAGMACLEGGLVAIRFLAKLLSADLKDGQQIDAEEVLGLNPATCLRLQNIAASFGFTFSEGAFWCDVNGISVLPATRSRTAVFLDLILSSYGSDATEPEAEATQAQKDSPNKSRRTLEKPSPFKRARRKTRANTAALHESLRVFVQAVSHMHKVSETEPSEEASS